MTWPGHDFNQQTDWNATGTYISYIGRTGSQSISETHTNNDDYEHTNEDDSTTTQKKPKPLPGLQEPHIHVTPGAQQLRPRNARSTAATTT